MSLPGPKCCPTGFWFLKNRRAKAWLIDRYLACGRGVVLRNRPAQNDPGPYGFEEPRHHARERRAGVFLGPGLRPALHANPVVPAIARHGRVERRSHHAYPGNLQQAVVNLPEQRLQLLRLIVAQHGVDPCDVAVLGFESEILVLQIAQAPAEQRRC